MNWAKVSDAVIAISNSIKCTLPAASEIFISYSRGANVKIRRTWWIEDLNDEFFSPARVDDVSIIDPDDWVEYFCKLTKSGFEWSDNRISIIEQWPVAGSGRDTDDDVNGSPPVTVIGGLEVDLNDLAPILKPAKTTNGGAKPGIFWPDLVSEIVLYFHLDGRPGDGGTSFNHAAKTILDRMASKGLAHPEAGLVRGLLSKIADQLLKAG